MSVGPTTYEQVYYVDAPEKMHMNPVAIRPKIRENRIEWEDTSRGTTFRTKKIEILNPKTAEAGEKSVPNEIEILTGKDETITLQLLSLKIFNEKVRDRVAGKPEFHSDQELREYYLYTNFETY